MNRTFESFDVRFACEGNRLVVSGTESSQRRLASHVIFEGTNGRFLDLATLERSFPVDRVKLLTRLLRSTFSRHRYYLNDFSFANLLVHLAILVTRAQHSRHAERTIELSMSEADQDLVRDLCDELEEALTLRLSPEDRDAIGVLVLTNVNQATPATSEGIRQAVGTQALDAASRIAAAILDAYGLDLNNDFFMPTFALHLKALFTRLEVGTINVNPMLQTIKRDCRVIYDIAVYMGLFIGSELGNPVAEDEIAFLALHVGAELERQRQNTGKIRSVLLCPGYRNIEQAIYNDLMMDHARHIDIIATVSTSDDLDRVPFDLLFSTMDVPRGHWLETQLITPFRISESRAAIAATIERVEVENKRRILRRNFAKFFRPELFYPQPPAATREELLRVICEQMVRLDCVTSDFLTQVNQREAASSTAFGQLAIPHSVRMDAIRTCVAVVICPDGFEWEPGKEVRLILLTAINRVGRSQFTAIYEALLSVFEDERSLDYLCTAPTFSALRELLEAE